MVCSPYLFRHFPLLHRPCFRREAQPNFEHLPPVRLIRTGVTLLLYLPQGLVGAFVQFELKYVNVPLRLHHTVHRSDAAPNGACRNSSTATTGRTCIGNNVPSHARPPLGRIS